MTNENNEVLKGETRTGDIVHQTQDMAGDKGFRNVSRAWFDKTITIDEGIDKIEDAKREREDIVCPIRDIGIGVNDDGKVVIEHKDGREFVPTDHAMKQLANWCDKVSHGIVKRLTNPARNHKGEIVFERDVSDAETLAMVFRNGKRRVDPEKEFRLRTYNDGTLRAMLTTVYAPVDNTWFMGVLKDFMPDARLSHWKGDADTLFGNLLIPDTIRKETDSEYGGMLSLSNCEIGKRRIDAIPSIFRAICMNGCIWDQVKGNGISKVHKGDIDLQELQKDIVETLNSQIPLMDSVIDSFLETRNLKIEKSDNVAAILATVAKDNGMTNGTRKSQLVKVSEEFINHESDHRNLFGIVNAITRAGQQFDRETWYEFDKVGGKLASMNENQWEKLRTRANSMDTKVLDKMFGVAA